MTHKMQTAALVTRPLPEIVHAAELNDLDPNHYLRDLQVAHLAKRFRLRPVLAGVVAEMLYGRAAA